MAQLEALEERRQIDIRHSRFNAALVTSALINVNRTSETEPVSPFDFLVGFERDPAEVEKEKFRRSVKQAVKVAFVQMRLASPEEIQKEKAAMIERMTANGVEDPEELIREVFPEL